ncbi:DUF2752 domain-containing protein [Stieleria sp. TO1_6]|uniref:DUF2752 domain-containing protein n=1 Tax=Stieleria tagensis TaxID=2956795 RepID=UPI00209B5A25|nr:DUF2752 domain-containing protein [Stieleria tagensis]MCO8125147.1 DUF2752 domain-containing protein [Stieleria tagensis]
MKPVPETSTASVSGGWLLRGIAASIALVLAGMLAVASQLQPSPVGLGTHHQLGLPPCSIRMLWGIRCPSCGMTTAWAHFMHADILAAATANLGGLLLAIYAIAAAIICGRVALLGRFPQPSTIRIATLVLIAIALVSLVEWIIRIL